MGSSHVERSQPTSQKACTGPRGRHDAPARILIGRPSLTDLFIWPFPAQLSATISLNEWPRALLVGWVWPFVEWWWWHVLGSRAMVRSRVESSGIINRGPLTVYAVESGEWRVEGGKRGQRPIMWSRFVSDRHFLWVISYLYLINRLFLLFQIRSSTNPQYLLIGGWNRDWID